MPRRLPPEVAARLRSDLPCPAFVGSDQRIFQGTDDGFGSNTHSRAVAHAKAAEAGVDVTGAKYFPGLADEQGDPKAWMRDTTDIRRRATEVGASIESPGFRVDGPAAEVADDQPYEVADDVVEKELDIVIDREHEGHVTKKKRDELFHDIKEKRSDVLFGDE